MKLSPENKRASSDENTAQQNRKRKRPGSHASTEPCVRQQTIQSLLAQQRKTTSDPATPASKRSRFSAFPAHTALSSSQKLAATDMYTFASRSAVANGNGVVDLTKGSPNHSTLTSGPNVSFKSRAGLNPQRGAKKLVVKNLKQNNGWDSKAYFEKTWDQLDGALRIIFDDSQDGFSREDLYRGVENVCRQGGASALFSRLEPRCEVHIVENVRARLSKISDEDNTTLLSTVLDEWKKWKGQMMIIQAVFFFLDRSYLLSSNKPTLSEMTPLLFRQLVFDQPELKGRIIDGVCDLVAADRKQLGQGYNGLFKDAVEMLHELSVYTVAFEPHFLSKAQEYISQKSDELIASETLSEYVSCADKIIAEEMSRCDQYGLDSSTRRDLLALLEEHLIERKETDLTDFEPVSNLLDDHGSKSKLAALYALLARRRLGAQLRPAFEKWIDKVGTSIVFADDSENMVIHLLALKRRLDMLWQDAFQRDEALGHGLRETFETFINKTKKGQSTWGTDNTKIGEMIAKYVDQLLRGGAKAIPDDLLARRLSSINSPSQDPTADANANVEDNEDADVDEDEEVNIQLDQVLDLFRFLHGKAVFEAFYKKDLARRLLMGRSASADAERSMLTRLKTECGSQFTQNLEQMFKDVELAREEMQTYKQRLEDRIDYEKGSRVDISVNILSAAAWPSYPDIPVNIPPNIQKSMADFELHYKSKHSGRKLAWKHALAHCQMRATFPEGTKELVVSSFQAIVLLLFSKLGDGEHLSYEHIKTETGLPEAEVKRTLQSLACAKLRPLTKHPKGREINSADTFTINAHFKHPKHRVKINQVQLKETKEENRETHERVQEDRNFETQAAIVRILKARKTISHSELISEVIKATMSRGRLEVTDIKKNIDRLIEKDYMEREDGNMYSYIA